MHASTLALGLTTFVCGMGFQALIFLATRRQRAREDGIRAVQESKRAWENTQRLIDDAFAEIERISDAEFTRKLKAAREQLRKPLPLP
jgi:hypothetical protein